MTNKRYQYDANGNRTSISFLGQTPLPYSIATTSNRLLSQTSPSVKSFSYDAAGNIISDGSSSLAWNATGRLKTVTAGANSNSYLYNGNGERLIKMGAFLSNAPHRFVYDSAGHLIGEYDSNNSLRQETLWLGDIPVAVIQKDPTTGLNKTYYVHSDHLNTPKVLLNSANVPVWRSDNSDAFGGGLPVQDPDGDGKAVEYNLRFPGQYYDIETGLHYNYFRDYNPSTGRYIQSDPIGLDGGLNTYGYVGGTPVNAVDPLGLTTIFYHQGSQMMSIYPEQSGRGAYFISASSGRPNCGCDETSKNNGPIPRGDYNLNSSDISNPPWYKDLFRNTRGDWGDWRGPLLPIPGTNTFGRSGFFLHGGSLPGSAGCIDFGGGLFGNSTSDQLLNDILNDPDGIVPVFVR